MRKYRSKRHPEVEVEACRWVPDAPRDSEAGESVSRRIVEWLERHAVPVVKCEGHIRIRRSTLQAGQWVVWFPNGDVLIYGNEGFTDTFERVTLTPRSDAAAQRARSLSPSSTTIEESPMSDTTRVAARFWVSEITESGYNKGALRVALTACTRGPENKTWAAATPVGNVQMTIQDDGAKQWFRERLGKDVTLHFGNVPDDEQPGSGANAYVG